MTIGERLLMGAAKIRNDGWCQEKYRDGLKVCVVGSLFNDPGVMLGDGIDQVSLASAYLSEAIGGLSPEIWNDTRGRTAEQAADALELAAIIWAEDQQQPQDVPAVLVGVGV